jgi:hypothetical protein
MTTRIRTSKKVLPTVLSINKKVEKTQIKSKKLTK